MPATVFATKELYKYQNGFDNHLEYVLLPCEQGMKLQTNRQLPDPKPSKAPSPSPKTPPKAPPYGLYAEKLSGTAFTAPPPRQQADLAVSHPAVLRPSALPAVGRAVPRRAGGRRHLQAALHPQPAAMGPL
ncbi:uncharacterized protein TrAtP1_008516 [Trichoderma atroviride]|uniref:uncharacterized protein n=1 Tax=Hypocrea atroviridis TaxID=63577 RepID=UPI00331D931D|nr:hypothetical protein TrAtP1_008516 [Trichoderma atroviride]